jgi:hypothetical protein
MDLPTCAIKIAFKIAFDLNVFGKYKENFERQRSKNGDVVVQKR